MKLKAFHSYAELFNFIKDKPYKSFFALGLVVPLETTPGVGSMQSASSIQLQVDDTNKILTVGCYNDIDGYMLLSKKGNKFFQFFRLFSEWRNDCSLDNQAISLKEVA